MKTKSIVLFFNKNPITIEQNLFTICFTQLFPINTRSLDSLNCSVLQKRDSKLVKPITRSAVKFNSSILHNGVPRTSLENELFIHDFFFQWETFLYYRMD